MERNMTSRSDEWDKSEKEANQYKDKINIKTMLKLLAQTLLEEMKRGNPTGTFLNEEGFLDMSDEWKGHVDHKLVKLLEDIENE